MPSEAKSLLIAQTEKPNHYSCPFLHRTAGDTERRYHLRYYKTCMCVHDTDTRGFCAKNGPHCAFAHGNNDLRPAVYDIKELQALENPEADPSSVSNGPNVLDKERNLMNEDPKWQDTSYVLANYKTEPCKRPPRLCRQGYACPQYHNSRDKRRSPRKFKYRSTPCPNVKHSDEWGEPGNCDSGDMCPYCHTRTEQQFHPEIYKSTKCNDVQTAGYCPRGVFCAFAHVERKWARLEIYFFIKLNTDFIIAEEIALARDLAARVDSGTSLADIMSSALGPEKRDGCDGMKREEKSSESSNGSGELSESASTSSVGSNSSHSKAPGSQLPHYKGSGLIPFSQSSSHRESSLSTSTIRKQIMVIDSDTLLGPHEKARMKQNIYLSYSLSNSAPVPSSVSPLANSFYPAADTVESVVGNALEDLNLDEPLNLAASLDKDIENDSPSVSNSISAGLVSSGLSSNSKYSQAPREQHCNADLFLSGLLGSSAPVNIPGSSLNDRSTLGNFSPSTSSPLQQLQSGFLPTSRFSHQDSLDSNAAFINASRMHLSSSASKIGSFNSGGLFDLTTHQKMSPSNHTQHASSSLVNSFSMSPSIETNLSSLGTNLSNDVQRLCEELASSRSKLASWDERITQARTACEAWQREAEETSKKANIAEQQRDEALSQAKALQKEVDLLQGSPYLHGLRRRSELKTLSLSILKSLELQLRNDLEEIEKVIYLQTATKCMVCEVGNRSVTLAPCNHFVLCNKCAPDTKECPYCQVPVLATSGMQPL
uniref:Unkempt protein n=1 Tax=Timema shepardi TaxID=629360 RepID=A0A7R9AM25_TIMSH|nr:unnamed protein product [Timema shepardi]